MQLSQQKFEALAGVDVAKGNGKKTNKQLCSPISLNTAIKLESPNNEDNGEQEKDKDDERTSVDSFHRKNSVFVESNLDEANQASATVAGFVQHFDGPTSSVCEEPLSPNVTRSEPDKISPLGGLTSDLDGCAAGGASDESANQPHPAGSV